MQSSLSLYNRGRLQLLVLDSREHERRSHRQAGGKLTLPLSEAVHCHDPRIQCECRRPLFGVRARSPCVFDGELDAAVSLACERDLGQCQGCFVEDEIEIHEMDIHAFRNGLACFLSGCEIE